MSNKKYGCIEKLLVDFKEKNNITADDKFEHEGIGYQFSVGYAPYFRFRWKKEGGKWQQQLIGFNYCPICGKKRSCLQ